MVFFNLFFNWWKLALQCHIGSCLRKMGISHNDTYIPTSLETPSAPPSHPSRSSKSTRLGSLYYSATSHQLSSLSMILYVC